MKADATPGTAKDPRIIEMLTVYVTEYMAGLGPYVSSLFLKLILSSSKNRKRENGYIKIAGLSIDEIAQSTGMSKRKVISALKVLRKHWIIIQLNRKGRGNKNYYYFLPVEKWVPSGGEYKSKAENMDLISDRGGRTSR